MVRLRPLIALSVTLLLAAVLTGCGGDKADSASAGAVSGGVDRTINLSESTARISSLDSFRFNLNASLDINTPLPSGAEDDDLGNAFATLLLGSLKDIKMEGAIVAPDQLEMKMSFAGQNLGFVQIGDEAWMQFGGAWTAVEPEDLGFSADSFDFSQLTAERFRRGAQAAKVTKEKVDGVNTTHYSFDRAALQSFAMKALGQKLESAELDVWLTDEGIPLKMVANMTGKDEDGNKSSIKFDFLLEDINGDIKIKAPM